MIVADTDVLIDFLRGHAVVADRIAMEIEKGLMTPGVSEFELWAGATGSKKREEKLEALLGGLTILPLDSSGARMAAEIQDAEKGRGRTMHVADSLIAGICINNRAVLLTRNKKHFESVSALTLGKF